MTTRTHQITLSVQSEDDWESAVETIRVYLDEAVAEGDIIGYQIGNGFSRVYVIKEDEDEVSGDGPEIPAT